MKLTYGQLRDANFQRGLHKLAHYAQYKNPKLAYNVAKISGKLIEEIKVSDKLHVDLAKQYAVLDDKGNFAPVEGKPGAFQVRDEVGEEWLKKLDEFHAVEVEVSRPPLSLDDVMVAGLSPMEIHALGPIVDFDETAADKPKLEAVK